jgi:hypothetical protein
MISKTIKAFLFPLIGSIFLFSCTTTVRKELVGVPPPVKISTIYTTWQERSDFMTEISSSFGISDQTKRISREGVEKIRFLIRAGLKDDLPESLRTVGLCAERRETAKGRLQITPAAGRSRCSGLGCQNDVDMYITLTDPTGKQTYWTGVIRAGAMWPSEQTAEVSKAFYKTVIDRLLENQLVQPGVCKG